MPTPEAEGYAEERDSAYIGLVQAQLSDEVGDGAEVLSLMRDSHLPSEDYLDRRFDTGSERQTERD